MQPRKNPPPPLQPLLDAIRRQSRGPLRLMEVCGGQTHAILRHGLDRLLPPDIHLLHGPGCPVCVTPSTYLDTAIAIARHPGRVVCSFGDLMRVPSAASGDLFAAKAAGADIRMVLSPLQTLQLAAAEPDKQFIFLAIGFETTAPANALAAELARARGIPNFSMLVSQFRVSPVLRAICADPDAAPDAFLAAGHVCAVTGSAPYDALARELNRPIAVTGFEPADLLYGVLCALRLWNERRPAMVNAYPAAVRPEGNPHALALMNRVFRCCDRKWRGLGEIPQSGLELAEAFQNLDAARRFSDDLPSPAALATASPDICPAADILRGKMDPTDCPHFGRTCTPDTPLGAPMVSPEGACAACFLHRPRAH